MTGGAGAVELCGAGDWTACAKVIPVGGREVGVVLADASVVGGAAVEGVVVAVVLVAAAELLGPCLLLAAASNWRLLSGGRLRGWA